MSNGFQEPSIPDPRLCNFNLDRISHTGYIRSGDFHLWVVPTMKTQQPPQQNYDGAPNECSVTSAGHSMPNLFSRNSGTSRICPEFKPRSLLVRLGFSSKRKTSGVFSNFANLFKGWFSSSLVRNDKMRFTIHKLFALFFSVLLYG